MRVVHVHRMRGIGGSERHLLTLLPALAARGIDVRSSGWTTPRWDPGPVLRARSSVPTNGFRAPRDIDPVLARRLRAR